MKKSIIYFGLVILLAACTENVSLEPENTTINYLTGEPVIVNLQQYSSGSESTFRIVDIPDNGTAEIINKNFLLYKPHGVNQDFITVERTHREGKTIVRLSLQNDESACGIARFDKKQIKKGESLTFDLVDNDKLCETDHTGMVGVEFLDESSSHYFKLQPNLSLPGISCSLLFNPPPSFTGSARILYVVALNQIARDKTFDPNNPNLPSITEILKDPAKHYKYYLIGIAEVEVVD